jgi:anaphase-promoting complex subunit 5
MAILQADFGCFDEAVAAMNETIATARENQDAACLNFSLSWLSHLSKAYPNDLKKTGYAGMLGPEKDRLAFLAEKARETKSWAVLSSTLLSEAKLALSVGADPAIVSEQLCQSGRLNFVHHGFSNCGTQLLIESAMYARTGLNVLADNDCEIILDCYNGISAVEDIARAECRRAQGANQFGQYARANTILESFGEETLRNLRLKQYIISHSGLVKLKHTLRKYDLVAAEHMLHQLKAGAWSDPDLNFQVAMLEMDYLIRQKSMATAFDKLEDLLEEAGKTQADIVHHIMLLLLKAELFSKVGKAGKGLTITLRAASMAHRYKLMPLLWEAMACLANILSYFGEFDHAATLMDAVLPQVRTNTNVSRSKR